MKTNIIHKKLSLCILSFPIGAAFVIPLSNLSRILNYYTENVYVITGKGGIIQIDPNHVNNQITETISQQANNIFIRIINYLILQIKISFCLIKISGKIDSSLFFMEDGPILPMMLSKILRKKIIWILPSNIAKNRNNANIILSKIDDIEIIMCRAISDQIVLYSPGLIQDWQLEKYRHKIFIAHEQFVNFNEFKAEGHTNISAVIGFIGRFSEEKGILNFLKAVPLILQERSDVSFLICGDGPLKITIMKYIRINNIQDKVEFHGWINHQELPKYYNKLKLLVMPSDTEGLPNTMLEAMACSTPVLATRVGAIPNVITDNLNGFLMENNSPECISQNVMRALNCTYFEQIAQNARVLVYKEFTFQKAVETYHNVLTAK
jgi:glycosyltransferase involved in cell wall biosynthesis